MGRLPIVRLLFLAALFSPAPLPTPPPFFSCNYLAFLPHSYTVTAAPTVSYPTDVISNFEGKWTLSDYRRFGKIILDLPPRVSKLHQASRNLLNGMRILYVINSYDFRQFQYLLQMLANIGEMCEFGWSVNVVIQTAERYNASIMSKVEMALFCKRQVVKLTIQQCDPALKRFISVEHRKVMQKGLDSHDVFIYSEDDMDIRLYHVLFYLWELSFMSGNRLPGFLRWNYVGKIKTACEGEARLNHISILTLQGRPYWIPQNPHQAFFILTREQLKAAATQCRYFRPQIDANMTRIRVFMSSWQLFHQHHSMPDRSMCKWHKVLPVASFPYFLAFTVHHLSNKHGDLNSTIVGIYRRIEKCVGRTRRREHVSQIC